MKKTPILLLTIVATLTLPIPLSAQIQPSRSSVADRKMRQPYADDTLATVPVASVVAPDLQKKGVLNNALDVLSGQTAGVNVTTNGLDRIAMLNSVRVRGTTSITGGNDPLVVIDGVTSDVATLATIYPADIESFTVLKNASETAMYGSRGASGVISVTTKKGSGRGFHIAYEGNYGLETMYKSMDMRSAQEHVATAQRLGLS